MIYESLKEQISIFKMVHIDKLDDTVNEYDNTYHRTIRKKHVLTLM